MSLETKNMKKHELDITLKQPENFSDYQGSSQYSCSSNMKSNKTGQSNVKSSKTIEKLKSPRGNPLPPINKNTMMDFLNDALDG